LFFAVLALVLFVPRAATVQDVKQIKITEKYIQGFMAAYDDIVKLYDGANSDKPDPKAEAQAASLAKKKGFASLAEYDDVLKNITMIMSGIDRQTKSSPSHPSRSRMRSRRLRPTNPSPEADKKEELAQLEAALKVAKPHSV